jgi:hypothetical protein
MNTNNINIKSGIEFPIELNEANITIREKTRNPKQKQNPNKLFVSDQKLELYSLEESREMWLQNEVNPISKIVAQMRAIDGEMRSIELSRKMVQKTNRKEYENSSVGLDLDYYDSVPLHERYKWDGFSSSDEI